MDLHTSTLLRVVLLVIRYSRHRPGLWAKQLHTIRLEP